MKSVVLEADKIVEPNTSSYKNRLAKSILLKKLEDVSEGILILTEGNQSYRFGKESDVVETAKIEVYHEAAYARVLFGGTIGAGEAFAKGLWGSPDPTRVVKLMLKNQSHLKNMDSRWSWLTKALGNLVDRLRINSLSGSRKNISAHYDLSNDFFSLFLDPKMMYSAAIYEDESTSLESAAEEKLRHVCERLRLNKEDHLVEIGSGWGGFAVYAAKNYGCKVTTTTISEEQYDYAREAIDREGLGDKIQLLKKDYRLLNGKFDKLVSIEMIEAVGHKYYKDFFSKCNSLLKDNGLALIQAILTGDSRFEKEKNKTDFIRTYIFPGGCLPSHRIISEMTGRFTDMHCVGIDDITKDYALTLRDWRQRFLQSIPQAKTMGFDDAFIRLWEFYLAYCEGGFSERVIHTAQYVFAKPEAKCLPCVVRS